MKKLIKLSPIAIVLLFLISCKKLDNKIESKSDLKEDIKKDLKLEKNQIEVRFSCGEDGISEYTNNGWVILKEYSEEKVCTWKSFPATKDCNMEKDKGCKITKPDKMGEEKIYLLEK